MLLGQPEEFIEKMLDGIDLRSKFVEGQRGAFIRPIWLQVPVKGHESKERLGIGSRAFRAARLLLDALRGSPGSNESTLVLRPQLVVRSSTAPPP